MLQIDFDASKPIYLQIIHEVYKSIARGELSPGDKIPSQRELAEQARVNPNTVQRAYREMEQMELVETLRGQGTFIKNNQEMMSKIRMDLAKQATSAFLKEMKSLGYRTDEIKELVENSLSSNQE